MPFSEFGFKAINPINVIFKVSADMLVGKVRDCME
jgi:hypothetical protein